MQRQASLDAIMRHNMVNINNPPYASNEPEWLSISPTIMTRINHSPIPYNDKNYLRQKFGAFLITGGIHR